MLRPYCLKVTTEPELNASLCLSLFYLPCIECLLLVRHCTLQLMSTLILLVLLQVIMVVLILKMRESIHKQVGPHYSIIWKIWNKKSMPSGSKTVFLTTEQLFLRVTKANPLPLPAEK